MHVERILTKDAYPFILGIHYAHRIPSISWAFGLFDKEELIGVVTYGTPPSPTLRKSLCKLETIKVLELNRLVLKYNRKNEASFLVAKSLKLLPTPSVIISFADTEQEHKGIVYQAANFLYLGLSAKRTDLVILGSEHLHSISVMDKYRGVPNRCAEIKKNHSTVYKQRPRKHRYVYILGSHKEKKQILANLLYKPQGYPK